MSRATAARRLAAVESALDPRTAVIHWLDGAHQHGSLAEYTRAVHEGGATSPWLDVPHRVRTAARAAALDRSRDGLAAAERRATGDALLLLELAMVVHGETGTHVREAFLRLDALRWEHVARVLDEQDPHDPLMVSWRRRLGWLRDDLVLHDATCRHLEATYLGGHPAAFPDVRATATELRARLDRLGDEGGLGAATAPTETMLHAAAEVLLVQARAGALDLLGRGAEAGDMVGRLLWAEGA